MRAIRAVWSSSCLTASARHDKMIRRVLPSLLLLACTPTRTIDVSLVIRDCRDQSTLLSSTMQLRVTAFGPDMDPIVSSVNVGVGGISLSGIPVGSARRLRVEALTAPPPDGVLVARGDSGPFDLTAKAPDRVTVFLRRVDGFTSTNDASDGRRCTRMGVARAGHSMTLLPDGRVLLAGGFKASGGGKVYLSDAEIYDPKTGTFSAATSSGGGHAFAAAVSLPDGVLVTGGEYLAEPGQSERYDAGHAIWERLTMQVPRSHHSATVDGAGRVLVAGGLSTAERDAPGLIRSLEFFDPAKRTLVASSAALATGRANQAAFALSSGAVMVAGGSDATNAALASVEGFLFVVADYAPVASLARLVLSTPRARPASALIGPDLALVAGGFNSTFAASARYSSIASTLEIIDARSEKPIVLPALNMSSARADACAAGFEGIGGVVIGGAANLGSGLASLNSVDVVAASDAAGTQFHVRPVARAMATARHLAACLRLGDGTILVTGGLHAVGDGTVTTVDSAEIYTP